MCCMTVCRPFCQNPVKDLRADTGCKFCQGLVVNVLLWLYLRQAKLEKNEMGVKPDPDVVTWPKAKRKCQCHFAQAERLVRFYWLQRAPAPRLNYEQG